MSEQVVAAPVFSDGEQVAVRLEGFPTSIAFSTLKAGNVSIRWETVPGEAQKSLAQLLGILDFCLPKRVHMIPAHADEVVVVGGESPEDTNGDILITTERGVALSLFPGDCFPVVITDTCGTVLSLVHAGWRGTDLEVARLAVEFMATQMEVDPSNLVAAIGPGIRSCCYTAKTRIQHLQQNESWKPFLPDLSRIDLPGYLQYQLIIAGVHSDHVFDLGLCTYCATDRKGQPMFFSNIRAGDTGEVEGRFAAIAML